MKNAIKTILSDINHVIIKGESDKTEQARVFLLLAIPSICAVFTFGPPPLY
ncbi:hypothetical protein GWR56_11730 [Mucilaginibacter sp. 14171R-50]|uniref:hypothetical protein n=1 Tax=Mucilaginibacter sp. 14171R-50 TaxID=2703789 RepID=UPI00138BCFA5|nr:hypothetical protein [Mucilaginibacter sp. 14171R-50]QHS56173.1 hypothetical protein GWR56_11730 [Mucilaginibacter sp. 14171R-50]